MTRNTLNQPGLNGPKVLLGSVPEKRNALRSTSTRRCSFGWAIKLLLLLCTFGFATGEAQAQWSVDYNGEQLRVWHNNRQVAVLHQNSAYFRMNPTPDSGWGTSTVIVPTLWSDGKLYSSAKLDTSWWTTGGNIVIKYTGKVDTLRITGWVTIQPPGSNEIAARVQVDMAGNVNLDYRPGEAFRPVFLSSMNVLGDLWDCKSAWNGSDWSSIPNQGLIWNTGYSQSRITLDGGTSSWKANAPTVDVWFDRWMTTMGWVTPSNNPNDDNVGLWIGSNYKISNYSYWLVYRKP